MKMRMNKYGEMSSTFELLIIKIKLYGTFDVNLWTKIFDPFLGRFWLIEGKIKMKMKRYRKMSSNFEFSISKLGYMELFIKISGKSFFWNFYLRRTEVSKGLIFQTNL